MVDRPSAPASSPPPSRSTSPSERGDANDASPVSPSGLSSLSFYEVASAPVGGPAKLATRFDLLTQQGFEHLRHERLDEAATAYEEAAKLAPDLPPGQPQIPELFALLALTRFYGDDLEGVEEALSVGKVLSASMPSPVLKQVEARLLLAQGENEAAFDLLNDAVAAQPASQNSGPGRYLAVLVEGWKALMLDGLGRVEEAAAQFERAEALAASSPYPDLKATATLNRADSAVSRGDHVLGERLARSAVEEARGKGDGAVGSNMLPDSLAYGLSVLGRALRLQGSETKRAEAGPVLKEALERSQGGGAGRWNLSSVTADLALLAIAEGREAEAWGLARDCDSAARASGEPGRIAEAHAVWAELALAQGDRGKADSEYRAALQIYRETGDTDLQAQIQQALDLLPSA